MRENLSGLLLRHSIIHRPAEVGGNLCNLSGCDQGADCDKAAVARRKVGTQPEIAEQRSW